MNTNTSSCIEYSERINSLKGRLIVSCQALSQEPLHSSFIMGRMAKAALEGGAGGIRANTPEDIAEIRKNVDLPIIGIIKKDYPGSDVYITPTMAEVNALTAMGQNRPDIIALDATGRPRPAGLSLDALYAQIRRQYPEQLLMADCSCLEEAVHADELGFDFIGTTLVGYTDYTRDQHIETDHFAILRAILEHVSHPVIAEGNIDTPQKAREVIGMGCFAVVVGGAITRPQLITKKFADAVSSAVKEEL